MRHARELLGRSLIGSILTFRNSTPRYNVHNQPTAPESGAKKVPNIPIPGGRRSIRVAMRKRANLVINLRGNQTMLPCLIVDKSQEGFRLRGNFNLRRGQLVELVVDDMNSVRCEVRWVGKAGSQQAGEAGFQAIGK